MKTMNLKGVQARERYRQLIGLSNLDKNSTKFKYDRGVL